MKTWIRKAKRLGVYLRKVKNERGQAMVLFGLMAPVIIGGGAIALETGYIYMAQHQLQQAADAASLAGIRELVGNDFAGAKAQAVAIAGSNTVAGQPVELDPANDIQFGKWDNGTFDPNSLTPNAMKVTVRRTSDSPGGPLPLYFSRIVGLNSAEISASAIAMLNKVDMALVLDRSSSMDDDTQCVYVNGVSQVDSNGIQPISQTRNTAELFVDDFDSQFDQLAVVSYATLASNPIEQQLTTDFALARAAVQNVPNPPASSYCPRIRNSPIWWTNIGDGIDKALQELLSARGRTSSLRVMVLISDGQPTCVPDGSTCSTSSSVVQQGKAFALQKADEASTHNVIIYTISLGSGADRQLMQGIAAKTGGVEFFSPTAADLAQVFDDVRKEIPAQLVN